MAQKKEQLMQCKHHSRCGEACGHKAVHPKNTGCLNMCIHEDRELVCKPVKK